MGAPSLENVTMIDSALDLDLERHRQLLIGGEWRASRSGARLSVDDPATGASFAEVADGNADDTADAIDAASAAFRGWADKPAGERGAILHAWSRLIDAKRDELARLLTREQGKPLAEARAEIAYANTFVAWFAEEARRVNGDVLQTPKRDRRVFALRAPVGVVAAITPWNFPSAMVTRKVAPALAAGCSVVLKPSELTPLSALALAALALEAGVPRGVFNVVVGRDAAAIGQALTADPRVRALSFTGSTAVGRRLYAACAGTVKKLALELGGNAPFLVFADADLPRAVEGLINAKFRNAGQTCISANRVLVARAVHDRFVDQLVARIAAMKVGAGFEAGVAVGPLITDAARARVAGLVDDALANGAVPAHAPKDVAACGARFYPPTVLVGVRPAMRIAREEIFGPVAAFTAFDDDDEALALANDTPFGLAAYFYTADQARTWRFAEALEAGIVGANESTVSNVIAPFGGVKESGIGREGSRHGIDEFTEIKQFCLGGL